MITITEYKAWFNAQAVLTPAERFKLKLFKEFGAYTRTIAKNSMIDVQVGGDAKKMAKRDRKVGRAGFIISGGEKVSKPGAAAFSRLGWIKQFIYFAADKDECVIGPALLSGVKSRGAVEALEHGGVEQLSIAKWVNGQRVQLTVTAQYKARPTMGLAFNKAIDKKLPKLIAGGIMREV